MSLPDSSNPFVGLRPFESDESLLFFGRQEQTLELLQRLHKHHFVAVVGSSGSGKSSLIRAGLIPSLKAGFLVDNRDRWMITIMKPGQSPLYNLADALLNQLKPGTTDTSSAVSLLEKIKDEGSDAVLDVIQHLWKEENTNFFLLVDQFEELFRFSMQEKEVAKRDEAIDFVNIMLELSRHTDLPVYVLITMRSDFIGDCAQFYGLPEAMNQSQYLVPRLNRLQLKAAIEGPVKLYGGNINAGLISKLLNDAGTVKDELPLLQHALMRVWDHEMNIDKSGELDQPDYEFIGGIEKALSNHADEALKGMNDDELSLAKRIFQALTASDENGRKIRRPAHVKELEEITGAGREQILATINRFIKDKRSFLVVNKTSDKEDKVIDISHESLIRQWNTLSGWVDEEAESAKTYIRLTESAKLYREKKKDLLMGNELQPVLQWYYFFKPSSEWTQKYNTDYKTNIQYLKQSEQAEKTKTTNKRIIIGGVIAGITAIALILFFAYRNAETAKKDAITQREANQNQLATNYWNNSQSARARNNLLEALHFIAEGVNISKSIDLTQNMLLDIEGVLPEYFLTSIMQHEGSVYSAVFSPDGKRVLTSSEDNTARLWDAASGKKICPEMKHKGTVYSAIFSPDGKRVLTASEDKTARLWDAVNGKQIGLDMKHEFRVNSAVFSPDGKRVLTASFDNTARLWDAASGKQIGPDMKHEDRVCRAVFSPDGKRVLTASFDKTARLWDVASGKQIGPEMKHEGCVYRAVFSPDGKRILTASFDKTARLWDAVSCRQIGPDMKHEGSVSSAVFSPDGKRVLTASSDKTARLWDAVSCRQIGLEMKHESCVSRAVFSPDGKRVLTASCDKTARLWDAASGKQIGPEMKHEDIVYSAVFSPDAKRVLTASEDKAARIWDVASGKQIGTEMKHEGPVNSAVFSPDGKRVLTASYDKTARLWYAANGKQIGPEMKHEDRVNSAVFSPDGKRVLTASSDFTARLWDAASGKQIGPNMKHEDGVSSAVFSSDGKRVLTASFDNAARLWDAASGKKIGPEMKHEDRVNSAVFSPDGKRVLTASDDLTPHLWDAANGKQIGSDMKHERIVNSAVFSPDGKRVLTASYDLTACLWDAENGKQIGLKMKHESIVNSAVFSPDGKRVLTASSDFTARLWDAASGKQIGPDMKHERIVSSAVFSPDGKWVLTASADSTARLWDASSGKQIGPKMKHKGSVNSAVFSPDGRRVLTASEDKTARLWDIGSDLDIPVDLFKLQARVSTGFELNIETSKIQAIQSGEWYKLKEDYNNNSREHYKICKYREYNFWSRFYPEEARKIREKK